MTFHAYLTRRTPSLLTLLLSALGTASPSWALELAMFPVIDGPPRVPPNVLISIEEGRNLDPRGRTPGGSAGSDLQLLVKSLTEVFTDTALIPDNSIRLAWNSRNYCGAGANWTTQFGTSFRNEDLLTGSGGNGMHLMDSKRRAIFLEHLARREVCSDTSSTGWYAKEADKYFRQPLSMNGPWAFEPGVQGAPYLGCRRNYHIQFTNGRWPESDGYYGDPSITPNFDGTARQLPDKTYYSLDYVNNAASRLYQDREKEVTQADWAMKSWADPLQNKASLAGELPRLDWKLYANWPDYEYQQENRQLPWRKIAMKVTNKQTGVSNHLGDFFNPYRNPATWPHMVTHMVSFSGAGALPQKAYSRSTTKSVAAAQPTSLLPYGDDGDLAEYSLGTYEWKTTLGDPGQDLWHAALNGRGGLYHIQRPRDLKRLFRSIIPQSEPYSAGSTGVATRSSLKMEDDTIKYPLTIYQGIVQPLASGFYNWDVPDENQISKWWGSVFYWDINSLGSMGNQVDHFNPNLMAGLNTADELNRTPPDDRVILSWRDGDGQSTAGGVPFRWAEDGTTLSPAHIQTLQGGDGRGKDRLDYLRGDRSREGVVNWSTDDLAFRKRHYVHGDIINSRLWSTGAPNHLYPLPGYAAFYRARRNRLPMYYVGANDGMLHGFSAVDATEKIAYVPRGVIPHLAALTEPGYDASHRYFVDGSPMTGDVQLSSDRNQPSWRTLLVGTLGAGGKGYFVLDVTDPGEKDGTQAGSFSEANAANLVVMDRTLAASEVPACVSSGTSCLGVADADLGHITALPAPHESAEMRSTQITRLNNDRWGVVLGNGYNSVNQRPVLLVQYLDGNKELLRLVATGTTATGAAANTTDNGLSAPRLVDLDGDGRPDVVYAGDDKGNLWKFIIASSNSADWGVAFGGQPLFTARGPMTLGAESRDQVQPISTAPIVRPNDRSITSGTGADATTQRVGGLMVAFGTGRNVARTDVSDSRVQSLYSVLDNTRYAYSGTGPSKRLVVQSACTGCNNGKDISAPSPLGTGVAAAALAKQVVGAAHAIYGDKYWTVDQTASAGKPSVDWATQNGWYLDLPEVGERVLSAMEFYDGSNILAVRSDVPARRPYDLTLEAAVAQNRPEAYYCAAPGDRTERRTYLTFLNVVDGRRPQVQLIDWNGDRKYDAADRGVSRFSTGIHHGSLVIRSKERITHFSPGRQIDLARMPSVTLRPSWNHFQ